MNGLFRQALYAVEDFFLPKSCISCKERNFQNSLVCEQCILGIEVLTQEYKRREKIDPLIKRVGAVFPLDSPMQVLNQHVEPYAKTIAALLMVQQEKFRWPWPDYLYPYQGYQSVGKVFSKWSQIPLVKRSSQIEKKLVLFLGPTPHFGALEERWYRSSLYNLSLQAPS